MACTDGSMLGGCVNMFLIGMNICPLFIQNPQLLRTVADYISRDVFLLIASSRAHMIDCVCYLHNFWKGPQGLYVKCNLTDPTSLICKYVDWL